MYLHTDITGAVAHLQPVFIDYVEHNLTLVLPVEELEGKPFIIKPLVDGSCRSVASKGIQSCENFRLCRLIALGIGTDEVVAAKPILAFDERGQKLHGRAAAFGSGKLDQVGVGKLMKMAIELGRPVNPNLHVGICGEHGGDPSSVEFCHKIGLNYVSCSPFRVPIARLAAAQAAIAEKNA
mgnify:CR=1 FL=1